MKLFLLIVLPVPFVCAFYVDRGDPLYITSMRVVKEINQQSGQPLAPIVPTAQVVQPIQQPVQQVQQQAGYEWVGVIAKYALICGGVYFLINQIKKKYEQKNSDLQNRFDETVRRRTEAFQEVIRQYQARMDHVADLSEDNVRVLEGLRTSGNVMHQKAEAIQAYQERIDPVLRKFVDNYALLVGKVQVLWQAVRTSREKGSKSVSATTRRASGASFGGAGNTADRNIEQDLELITAINDMERDLAALQVGHAGAAAGAAIALPMAAADHGGGDGNGLVGAQALGVLNAQQAAHVLDPHEREELGIPRD